MATFQVADSAALSCIGPGSRRCLQILHLSNAICRAASRMSNAVGSGGSGEGTSGLGAGSGGLARQREQRLVVAHVGGGSGGDD
jgi:hypothetical protein